MGSQNPPIEVLESVQRIEPTMISSTEKIADLIADLSSKAATLGSALHPKTAVSLASLVRIMNCYYTNLIEGHKTRPKDIERGLEGHWDQDPHRRNLQIEATAHVRVQEHIDELAISKALPNPVSKEFLLNLHHQFYQGAPLEFLRVQGAGREFILVPGEWRSKSEHDVAVGRHEPPSSERVGEFMDYFSETYTRHLASGKATQLIALATSHHRFNYIHPFPDGNGRVSRLMSHAFALQIGVGANGLWSIARGLARGIGSRSDYRQMMDHADQPRRGDLDGRGNLSEHATREFVEWFLSVCIDQIEFMSSLFDLKNIIDRIRAFVASENRFPVEAARLLEEA
ncbi:MAG: Fic family protein, partial [Bdellovibrionales bacterium]|nr:Fic family protein [Bdellovibrionales bacterium]